jgi:methyltransferase (TIGR00027 family)
MALFRALESGRRGERLFTDRYAAGFLRPSYRRVAWFARLPHLGALVPRYIDARWPAGPRASAIVRTRLIDDLLREALAAGARQVLLLGAGYDTRPYRIPATIVTRTFEVDHPATQAAKQRLLRAQVSPARLEHVRFVPADLVDDDLGATLREAGVRAVPTVVVWEGVTNYLTAEAVDASLRCLVTLTGPGSRIIFTYVDRGLLDGTGGFTGAKTWLATVRAGGEPFTFGFDPGELAAYLAERGLRLTTDVSTRQAAERYLAPLGRYERAAPFYHVAEAEVV